jgi:hypothetical protein
MNGYKVFALFMLLTACAQAVVVKPELPQTEEKCLAKGGTWSHEGLPESTWCKLETTDGGNPCSDSSKCQGECVAPKNAAVDAKVEGACSNYVIEPGCRSRVENGRVEPMLCVD